MDKFILNKNIERHKARLCEKLREAKIPEIAIDAVRKEFDFLKQDLENVLSGVSYYEQEKNYNK